MQEGEAGVSRPVKCHYVAPLVIHTIISDTMCSDYRLGQRSIRDLVG